jgi:hypothetical protein
MSQTRPCVKCHEPESTHACVVKYIWAWLPSQAPRGGLASQTRTCMGTFTPKWGHIPLWGLLFLFQLRCQLILPCIRHHLPKLGAFLSLRKKQHVSPNSGAYLHDQITSHPNTPRYSYLDQGWPARTALGAVLLGSNQAKATCLFTK